MANAVYARRCRGSSASVAAEVVAARLDGDRVRRGSRCAAMSCWVARNPVRVGARRRTVQGLGQNACNEWRMFMSAIIDRIEAESHQGR